LHPKYLLSSWEQKPIYKNEKDANFHFLLFLFLGQKYTDIHFLLGTAGLPASHLPSRESSSFGLPDHTHPFLLFFLLKY
jgi:hypothetical protein